MFVEGPSYQILALLIRFEAFYIISFNRLKITVVGTVCTANLTSRECKGALQILFGGLSAKGGGGTPPQFRHFFGTKSGGGLCAGGAGGGTLMEKFCQIVFEGLLDSKMKK